MVARADEESVIYRSAVPGGVTFAPSATKASPLWIRGEAVTCIDDTGTASEKSRELLVPNYGRHLL